ncbi:unnamed protein product [Ixodes hexagonus]
MNAFEAAYPPLLAVSGETPCGSDSDGEDDVIDVLSADHCAGEHSYTMPMPPSMILEAEQRRAARRPAPQPELPSLSPELSAAHRLVQWMGSPVCRKYSAPFLEPMEAEQRPAYAKVVRRPMCLSRVKASLEADEYASITEVVRDLRLILENCYRFFGPSHCFSKKAQKLETVLEQKLALLPRELREKTTLEATTLDNRDTCAQRAGRRARLSNLLPSGESSALLQLVKAEKAARAREERLKQREERKVEKEVAQQAATDWDHSTFGEGLAQLSSFWEVPQVCHFLRVTQEPLQLPQAPMCELERMFLMPQKSSLLAVFMTCLLVAPQHRPKVLVQPPMPYRVWAERLRNRLQVWYRTYHSSQRNGLKVFEAHGIEEQFFAVLGDADPLESKDYHDLTLRHRVWLFKALCDHKLGQHRRVQEWMAEQEADSLRETLLGQDREGRTYLYFPCLCEQDLRIYRQGRLEYEETPPPQEVQSATKKSAKHKKKGRTRRSSSKKSSRQRKASSLSWTFFIVTPSPADEKEEPETEKKDEDEAVASAVPDEEVEKVPAPEAESAAPSTSQSAKEVPSFETVASSVADLRALIAQFGESDPESSDAVTTRSQRKEDQADQKNEADLVERLRELLAELEPNENKFQQTEVAVRIKLHKEWHNATPDGHNDEDAEEALDSWTMHYKDEEGFDESSSDESIGLEEGKDNEEDYLEEDAMEDSGWRVLRKRKIPLTNGVEDAGPLPEEQPVKQPPPPPPSPPPNLKRFLPVNSELTSSGAKLNPRPIVPNVLRKAPKRPIGSYTVIRGPSTADPTLNQEPATSKAKVSVESAKPGFRTYSQPAATGVVTQKVVTKPATSEALMRKMVYAPSNQHVSVARTYVDRKSNCRAPNVRSLLAAGITTFSEPPKPPTAAATAAGRSRLSSADSTSTLQKYTQLAKPVTTVSSPVSSAVPMTAVSRHAPSSWTTTVYSSHQHARPETAIRKSVYSSASSATEPAVVTVRNCEPTPAVAQSRVPLSELASVIPQDEGPTAVPEPQAQNLQTYLYENLSAQQTKPSATFTNSVSSKSAGLPQTTRMTQTHKAVLVPAVDGSGQEILLHVEYSTVDEMPTNTQSFTPVAQPSPSQAASVQNHRRGTSIRTHYAPWWKRGACTPTVKVKDPPPLAPITHRKIFKSRNVVAATQQRRPVERRVEAVTAECATPVSAADFMTLSGQQMLAASGSNGSQLVFLMPQESPQKAAMSQLVLQAQQQQQQQQQQHQQQPEPMQTMGLPQELLPQELLSQEILNQEILNQEILNQELLNQELLNQVLPGHQQQQQQLLTEEQQTVQILSGAGTAQQTPLLLLTSDGRLLQVVQQHS